MEKPKPELLFLYALRQPVTSLHIRDLGPVADISVDVRHVFSGTLRVPTESVSGLLARTFRYDSQEVGVMSEGKVTWYLDPETLHCLQVIDERGNLHDIDKMETT